MRVECLAILAVPLVEGAGFAARDQRVHVLLVADTAWLIAVALALREGDDGAAGLDCCEVVMLADARHSTVML